MGTCWKCLIKIGVLSDLINLEVYYRLFRCLQTSSFEYYNLLFSAQSLSIEYFQFLSVSDLLSLAPLLLCYKEQLPLYLVIDFLRPFQ